MNETAASSARLAHQDLREELLRAAKAGGETGRAARHVMQVLFPHMVMEERSALPARISSLSRISRCWWASFHGPVRAATKSSLR